MNLILVDDSDRAQPLGSTQAPGLHASTPLSHSEPDPATSPATGPATTSAENQFVLRDRRARHICEIHRAKIGDTLKVGFLEGKIGRATVTSIHSDAKISKFEVTLKCEFTYAPPPPPDIHLWIALPRPKFLSKVIETATTFGIKHILFFNSYRVDKVYWSCDQITPDRIEEFVRLGLEQAGDTIRPTIEFEKLFRPFIEDRAREKLKNRKALLAHPNASVPCPYNDKRALTVAIGPEGGFVPFEIDKLLEAGFTNVDLFPRILKVETAVAAILGRLI